MTTITLSTLKSFNGIDDPNASALERAIMHALDSMPKENPDKQITDADIAAFKAAFPSMGASLDRTELGALLDVMQKAGTGTTYEAGNMTLVAAARAELYGYSWSSPTGTEVSAADLSAGDYATTFTDVPLPSFTVGTLPDGSTEGVWQIAERVKTELGASYPDVLAMPTAEVAYKLLQANDLAMNADGSYPALRFGQVLQVAPYADGAMERVGALLEEVVKDLPEATKHMVLATLAIGVGIFLASLWMTPGPATVAVLGYLATALGEAFMVGAGVGLVTLLAEAAMGSATMSTVAEVKANPAVGTVGANMVTALAGPKAVEYAGKGVTAASPYVKDALGKLSGILKPAAPVMESIGTLGGDVPVVGRVGGRSLTLGAAPILPSGAKSIYMQVRNIETGEIALMEITAPRGDMGTYVADLATGTRPLPNGYALPDDGLIYLTASADDGAPIFATTPDQAAAIAPAVFDKVGLAVIAPNGVGADGKIHIERLPDGLDSKFNVLRELGDPLWNVPWTGRSLGNALGTRSVREICLMQEFSVGYISSMGPKNISFLRDYLHSMGLKFGMTEADLKAWETSHSW